jgi:hypothetical protein
MVVNLVVLLKHSIPDLLQKALNVIITIRYQNTLLIIIIISGVRLSLLVLRPVLAYYTSPR